MEEETPIDKSLINSLFFVEAGTKPKTTQPYTRCVYFTVKSIVELKVEAIVNAANTNLISGGGICGAIFRSSDSEKLQKECFEKAPCPRGECVLTQSYSKSGNYKYIIHAVGPVGEDPDLLEKTYVSVLNCCVENGIKEVAIPCISTGIYGYPEKEACIVVSYTIKEWLRDNPGKIDKIILSLFTADSFKYYKEYTNTIFAEEDQEGEKEVKSFRAQIK